MMVAAAASIARHDHLCQRTGEILGDRTQTRSDDDRSKRHHKQ
jgi:hypothetical protein